VELAGVRKDVAFACQQGLPAVSGGEPGDAAAQEKAGGSGAGVFARGTQQSGVGD